MGQDLRDYEKKWPGLPIQYLILSTDEFIVFLDDVYDLDWKTSDEFDKIERSEDDSKLYNQSFNEIAYTESIPCDDLPTRTIICFKRQLGEAIVRIFKNDFDNSKKMIDFAKSYIIERNVEKSRYLYLKSSGITTLAFTFIGLISWLSRDYLIETLGSTAFYLGLSFIMGSLGAFLSITLRIGNTNLDYNASKKLHYMEGISKIFAGMISGLLISLCIKTGLIFAIAEKTDHLNLIMILGGLIAGSSERLAPSIIKDIETTK